MWLCSRVGMGRLRCDMASRPNLQPFSMKPIIGLFLSLLFCVAAVGQIPRTAPPMKGRFYIDVDDGARIFINGQLAHTAGIDTSISGEVSLAVGDRVVAQLTNNQGGKWLKLVFLSTDQRSIISFQRLNYRILNDLALVDFTVADWSKFKPVKNAEIDRNRLSIKNNAASIWGDAENTTVGSVITADMVKNYTGAPANAPGALPLVLTVEALVDGNSTLVIRPNGIQWVNGPVSKPGLLKEPTLVNGKEWMPKWSQSTQERGFDRSDVFPITLDTLDLSVELISNAKERGANAVDPSRTPIQVNKKTGQIEIVIPDPESGQRWYSIGLRGRKK